MEKIRNFYVPIFSIKPFDRKIKTTIFTFSLLGLVACSANKPNANKSAKKLYESFYLGTETMQYFIKPLEFFHEDDLITLDITFRNTPLANDSSIINISVFNQKFLKKLNSISIANNDLKISLDKITFMFTEKQSKNYLSRFTAKLMNTDIEKIFKNNQWKITMMAETGSAEYLPRKKTQKNIEKLNGEVFILAGE